MPKETIKQIALSIYIFAAGVAVDFARWLMRSPRTTAAGFAGALASDEHVPEVTLAPTVAKADGADDWIVFTPAPDAHGSTLTDGEIRVEKDDEAGVVTVWPVGTGPSHRITQTPYPAVVCYRWRNQSAEDAGNGRGWSDWSPTSPAAETGAGAPPAPAGDVVTTFTFDTNDSRAAVVSEVISAE